MRVTMKIQVEHLSIRHNLDLYNDNQVEKLVRKAADKLEIGTSVTTAALNDLTDLLEQYRLAEIEKQNLNEDKRKIKSADETKEAQSYLSAPNLMERTKEDIGRAGVIGEENSLHHFFPRPNAAQIRPHPKPLPLKKTSTFFLHSMSFNVLTAGNQCWKCISKMYVCPQKMASELAIKKHHATVTVVSYCS